MKSIFKDSIPFEESIAIEEDTSIVWFFTKPTDLKKITAKINVNNGCSFTFTAIDFAYSDLDIELEVSLSEGAKAELNVASLNHSFKKIYNFNIKHLERNTYSRTKMGGINDGTGTLKFLGTSYIKNGAHKSDTRQEGRITNLSPDCKSEVSPSLLIKENDVKASHGAALGAYNPDHLYYLMSRGLSLDESKKLVTYGSLLPIIEASQDDKVIEEAKEILGDLTL